MGYIGLVVFQSETEKDIFLKTKVQYIDGSISDEGLMGLGDVGFDYNQPYLTGVTYKKVSVNVEGDSGVIYGWLRIENFPGQMIINIYLEYEEVESLET